MYTISIKKYHLFVLLSFYFWSLCWLSFFDRRLLIILLISSNFSSDVPPTHIFFSFYCNNMYIIFNNIDHSSLTSPTHILCFICILHHYQLLLRFISYTIKKTAVLYCFYYYYYYYHYRRMHLITMNKLSMNDRRANQKWTLQITLATCWHKPQNKDNHILLSIRWKDYFHSAMHHYLNIYL